MATADLRVAPVRVARIRLLGDFALAIDGQPVSVPSSIGRVLSFLALASMPSSRAVVAGSLWPDATDGRAAGNLRTSLWRLGRFAPALVAADHDHLILSGGVEVDYTEALRIARALVDPASEIDPEEIDEARFKVDLLTDQEGDWVDFERVRFRQIRLHALEALADRLSRREHHARTIEVALSVVAADPLRESAHELLIRAFLAEGNRGEAIAQYLRLAVALREQLGLEPPEHVQRLLRIGCGGQPA